MPIPKDARHSPDFCSMLWNGVEHSFTPMQAAIVEMLWNALANDTPDVHASTLLAHAESKLQKDRIQPLFYRHPAWKTMIVPGKRRGTYRLEAESHKKKNREFLQAASLVLHLCFRLHG